MTRLRWKRRTVTLGVDLQDIEGLKREIFALMGATGTLADLELGPHEITGERNGVRVVIAHLRVNDRKFHEVVMAAGEDPHAVLSVRDEVATKIERFGE